MLAVFFATSDEMLPVMLSSLTDENGITLWCCGDQIRKGAASNAVQILKLLAEKE